jgi:hypothetical protein
MYTKRGGMGAAVSLDIQTCRPSDLPNALFSAACALFVHKNQTLSFVFNALQTLFANTGGYTPLFPQTTPKSRKSAMRKIWSRGPLLGAVIFLASVCFGEYLRWTHGVSMGLKTDLFLLVLSWRVVGAYLVLCLVAGCLLYAMTSLMVHVVRRIGEKRDPSARASG